MTEQPIDTANMSYSELKAYETQFRAAADLKMKAARGGAIEAVSKLIAEFGITSADLSKVLGANKGGKDGVRNKAPAKYRDPATGKEWTGRGVAPGWIKDQDRAAFLIPALEPVTPEVEQAPTAEAEAVTGDAEASDGPSLGDLVEEAEASTTAPLFNVG